jgi:hypothetical protein
VHEVTQSCSVVGGLGEVRSYRRRVRKAEKALPATRPIAAAVCRGAVHSLVSQSVRGKKKQAAGAQLLSEAEQRRGPHSAASRFAGEDILSVAPSTPGP